MNGGILSFVMGDSPNKEWASSCLLYTSLKDFMQQNPDMPLKEIRMFWNRMDGRVSKRLFHQYGLLFKELGLKVLDTVIPDMERYGRETSPEERILFRSTDVYKRQANISWNALFSVNLYMGIRKA